eukprot:GHVU01103992.1.p1 GENE.GHVU01103992.1~~GHVU01103992.1.p1  ORF type:complete len:659 (-),score=80.50 GHVU01103992.1:1534-3510(-)
MEPDSDTTVLVVYYEEDLVMLAESATLPPSHQLVKCPVANCSETPRRGDVSRHLKRDHRGHKYVASPRPVPFRNRITGFFRPKRSYREMSSWAAAGAALQENSSAAELASSTTASSVAADFIERSSAAELASSSVAADLIERSSAAELASSSVAAHSVESSSASTPPGLAAARGGGGADERIPAALAGATGILGHIWAWLGNLDDRLAQLPQKAAAAFQAAEAQKAQEKEIARIRGVNVEDIAERNGLTLNAESLQLRCEPCCKWGAGMRTPDGAAIQGIFSTAQPLYELKKSIGRHYNRGSHSACVERAAQEADAAVRRRTQGMANGRAVYSVVKEGASYQSYERLLMLLHLNGVHIGSLNHGRKFCAGFVRAIREVVEEDIRTFLDTPCPVIGGRKRSIALVADKSTNLRQTGQLAAAIVLAQGKLRCIMLANTVVGSGQGKAPALAQLLVDNAVALVPKEELSERCSGMAFDGQYIAGKVPEAVRDIIGGSQEWRTSGWDVSHKIELVCFDCRQDKVGTEDLNSISWYSDMPTTVTTLLNRCQWGKGFQELRDAAEEMDAQLWMPLKFSETRFVKAALKVYVNLLRNYGVLVNFYTNASTVPEGARRGKSSRPRVKRNKHEKAAFRLLMKLKDQLFVGRLLVVADLYQHLTQVRR